jgi:AraC family transcriptional regulator
MTNQSSLVLAFPGSNFSTPTTERADFPIAMRAPQWLKRAREIVETRFLEPLSLAEIAAAVGVHLVHLSREFHRYNRCTVGELIRRRRVEHACDLLKHSDLSLAEIALACGFSDQSHFSMMFKRHMGITPSRFRKSVAMDVAALQTAS